MRWGIGEEEVLFVGVLWYFVFCVESDEMVLILCFALL